MPERMLLPASLTMVFGAAIAAEKVPPPPKHPPDLLAMDEDAAYFYAVRGRGA